MPPSSSQLIRVARQGTVTAGWLEQAGFVAMEFKPTDIHLQILHVVGRSGNGIDAVADKCLGLECVDCGWLEHVEHRRDDGQIIDVWTLTHHGRAILKNREGEILGTLLIEAA